MMEFAQDDAGDLVVGDVAHVRGKALTVGISGITGDEVLSIGWVETGETINLTLRDAITLRDEIDKIIRDRHTDQ